MDEVWVVATAAVSALGENQSELWRRLLTGESAMAPPNSFSTAPFYCKIAAEIKNLQPDPQSKSRLPSLLEKLFKDFPLLPLPKDCSLIGATLKGAIDSQEKIWAGEPAAEKFAASNWVAQHFNLNNPGITINAACASSTIALTTAASRIAAGCENAILVWAAEILSEFVFAGFASLQALTPDTCRPFDKNRNGLALGEGAAALLLMSEKRALKEGHKPLTKITGWGSANDAVHLTAPSRDGRGLIKACYRALSRGNLRPENIAAINAHGTGTIHNDNMEIAAFSKLFGPRKVPFHSIKGALGHTLGAAGALETVIAIESLNQQLLPPTTGLKNPENEVLGQVSPGILDLSGNHLLITNSGFGGVNAALVLTGG